jgi:hypothetical protein
VIEELTSDHITLRQYNHDVDNPGDTEMVDSRFFSFVDRICYLPRRIATSTLQRAV